MFAHVFFAHCIQELQRSLRAMCFGDRCDLAEQRTQCRCNLD
jgi:hypothetical protein